MSDELRELQHAFENCQTKLLEHKSKIEEYSALIFKFGTTLNGVALSIALVALSSLDPTNDKQIVEISSIPLWAFFAGMISAGLMMLVSVDETEHNAISHGVHIILKHRNKAENDIINTNLPATVREHLRELVDDTDELFNSIPEFSNMSSRKMTWRGRSLTFGKQLFLCSSFLCFIFGMAWVIASINP